MTPQERRELNNFINSHAVEINNLIAIVSGLAAELAASQGEEAVDRAKARALAISKSMTRPMQSGNPDDRRISQIFDAAKGPI